MVRNLVDYIKEENLLPVNIDVPTRLRYLLLSKSVHQIEFKKSKEFRLVWPLSGRPLNHSIRSLDGDEIYVATSPVKAVKVGDKEVRYVDYVIFLAGAGKVKMGE